MSSELCESSLWVSFLRSMNRSVGKRLYILCLSSNKQRNALGKNIVHNCY